MLTAASSAVETGLKGNGSAPQYSPEYTDPRWSPSVRLALLRNGYLPTPTHGKAPVLENWPNIHATEADVAVWEKKYPDAGNTGILTARTPTVDVDVLDENMAKKIHAQLVEPLIPEGYPKLVRVGLAPKHAVPFRSEQPFPKIATPRYVSEDGRSHRVEVLARIIHGGVGFWEVSGD
jgi:bifunctional DNA primase/polymerase-like protein